MEGTEIERQLIELERRFWTAGVEFYETHLATDCVMLFPGAGVLSREAAIAGVAGGGPRWRDIEMKDVRVVVLHDAAAILAYAAVARKDGSQAPYSALVGSVYASQDGAWKLAFHQQSPLAAS